MTGKVAFVVSVFRSIAVAFQNERSWLMSSEARFARIPNPVTVKLNELIKALSCVSLTLVMGAVFAFPP
jgi:hypothetical protein